MIFAIPVSLYHVIISEVLSTVSYN